MLRFDCGHRLTACPGMGKPRIFLTSSQEEQEYFVSRGNRDTRSELAWVEIGRGSLLLGMVIQPTEQSVLRAFDQLDPPDPELFLDCIHCGFCLPTCPTYLVLGNEMDSPRGRLYLIRTASEGKTDASDSFVKHMGGGRICPCRRPGNGYPVFFFKTEWR